VCWSSTGHHRAAGILAAVIVAFVVVGLPALTFAWVWRDPWLSVFANDPHLSDYKLRKDTASPARSTSDVVFKQRFSLLSDSSAKGEARGSTPLMDPLLGVFYGYKPEAWYTKHLDLLLLLLLSLYRSLSSPAQ